MSISFCVCLSPPHLPTLFGYLSPPDHDLFAGRSRTKYMERESRPDDTIFHGSPSTEWVTRSLSSCRKYRGEESNDKTPQNGVRLEEKELYTWFPDAWTKREYLF
ncbi:hypothetical protein PoB_003052300 [Plakobranchus ocellatus]|uniref:Uncharacterized protein n=1 Tax=Plakobranchus ocellatus TaxID=259542 RepID=A0AAV4ABQ5_9GAST|nr:hypothetical protein PoB_003052300 [Plakobranchus ocellatus]